MKKVTLLLTILCFSVLSMFAQINEGASSMSKGNENAFTLELRQTQEKEISKAWEKFIKGYKGKVKKDKKSGEILADDCQIKEMSSNTVDVYSSVRQSGENTILTVWYDLGGAFLNSGMHGDKIPVVEKMLKEFAINVDIAAVEEDLKNQEKTLKNLEKDLKGLEKDKEKSENEIAKCEKKILEEKESIKVNLTDQKNKTSEIEAQRKVVEEIKSTLKKMK